MKKSMGFVALSVVVAFLGTACEIYHDGDCDDWDSCGDYCYEGCDDDWDVDWEDDWDDWEDDWDDHDEDYCREKLECLDACSAAYEQTEEVIEAVLCYGECFFSFDECVPAEHTFDDPCNDSFNVCMGDCHQEMGCATSQMECFEICVTVRDTCRQEDGGSAQNPPDNSDDGPVDPPTTPTCKDTYDSCVDGCEWDQWICHENCYESFYECKEAEAAGELAGDGGSASSSGKDDDIC